MNRPERLNAITFEMFDEFTSLQHEVDADVVVACDMPLVKPAVLRRLVDAIGDSHSYIHGKRFAVYGDPDFCLGMSRFLMEMGGEPVTVP